MILDFNYPNLTAEGWLVNVIKVNQIGSFTQKMKFERKEDAFEYYNTVRQMWLNQQTKQKEER